MFYFSEKIFIYLLKFSIFILVSVSGIKKYLVMHGIIGAILILSFILIKLFFLKQYAVLAFIHYSVIAFMSKCISFLDLHFVYVYFKCG